MKCGDTNYLTQIPDTVVSTVVYTVDKNQPTKFIPHLMGRSTALGMDVLKLFLHRLF